MLFFLFTENVFEESRRITEVFGRERPKYKNKYINALRIE